MAKNIPHNAYECFLNFSAQDLKANRAGQLTIGQLKNIRLLAESEKGVMIKMTLGMLLFFGGGFFAFYYFNTSFRAEIGPYFIQWSLIALGIPLLALLISFFTGQRMNQDFSSVNKVEVARGAIKKRHHFSDGLHGYEIRVEGVKFPVHEKFYNKLAEDKNYAFYYVPATSYNLILSWEKI